MALVALLLHINHNAVTSVWERTSVFRNHELAEFQYSKFSELQLVVHTTVSRVLDDTGEDAYFRRSASSTKKKKKNSQIPISYYVRF